MGCVQRRVGDQRLEMVRRRPGGGEVGAKSVDGVDLDRHPEAASFAGDEPYQIILEHFVLGPRRHAAGCIPLIDRRRRRRVGGLEIERPEIGGLELGRHGAPGMLPLERGRDDVVLIPVERCRHFRHAEVAKVPLQQDGLERIQHLGIRRPLGLGSGVERQHQRVGEGHPTEPRRLDPGAHDHPVGEHHADMVLVEDPDRKPLAMSRHHVRHGLAERLGLGRIIAEDRAVERALRVGQYWITRREGGRHLERRDGSERAERQGVGLGVGRRAGGRIGGRVSVGVDRRQGVDVGRQALISAAWGTGAGRDRDDDEQTRRTHPIVRSSEEQVRYGPDPISARIGDRVVRERHHSNAWIRSPSGSGALPAATAA